MVFISTNIISQRPIKLRNHIVISLEKGVSFKVIKGLRSGLNLIPSWLCGNLK